MRVWLFSILIFLTSCSSQLRKEQTLLRAQFQKKQYKLALKGLEKSLLKKDKDSKLLYLAEKGRLLLAQNKNLKAAIVFEEAIQVSDDLYTKSLTNALQANLVKRYERYFGEYYERSMLYYYQTLSYLKVSEEQKNEKDQMLWVNRARATLLLWDSTLQGMKKSENYDSLFVQDIWNRIFAATIHEHIGERQDLTIALQLFKDAKDSLKKVALTYSAFNEKYDDLSLEIRKALATNTLDQLDWKKLTKETPHLTQLKKDLDLSMLEILKKKKMVTWQECSRLEIAKELCKMSAPLENNVTILLEEGLISPKVAEDFSYNLRTAIESIDNPDTRALIHGIGVPILTYFALGSLGLGYYSHSESSSVYVHHNAGSSLMEEVGIEWEMTGIKPPPKYPEQNLVIKGKDDLKIPFPVVASLSDLGKQALTEKNSKEGLKNAARIGAKYVTAIVAAYGTYNTIKASNSDSAGMEFWAKTAALATYVAATKAIKASEAADLRHWTTLPSAFRMKSLHLDPGEYALSLENNPDKKSRKGPKKVGKIKIEPGRRYIFPYISP